MMMQKDIEMILGVQHGNNEYYIKLDEKLTKKAHKLEK
jgi:hypothetical protein